MFRPFIIDFQESFNWVLAFMGKILNNKQYFIKEAIKIKLLGRQPLKLSHDS